jgi:hypothetical protein
LVRGTYYPIHDIDTFFLIAKQVYSYMNNVEKCQGVHWNKFKSFATKACQTDVWPPTENKYVKNSWDCYAPEGSKKGSKVWCRWEIGEDTPEEEEEPEFEFTVPAS